MQQHWQALIGSVNHLVNVDKPFRGNIPHCPRGLLAAATHPSAVCIFILVEGLTGQGWVHVFGRWWDTRVNETGVVGAVGGMLIGSGLLCNVCHFFVLTPSDGQQSSRHHRYVVRIYRHDHFSSANVTGVGTFRAGF